MKSLSTFLLNALGKFSDMLSTCKRHGKRCNGDSVGLHTVVQAALSIVRYCIAIWQFVPNWSNYIY